MAEKENNINHFNVRFYKHLKTDCHCERYIRLLNVVHFSPDYVFLACFCCALNVFNFAENFTVH